MIKIIKSLAEVRKEKGFTQEQMASQLGIGVSTYNLYESGKRTVPEEIANKIALILNVKLSSIFSPKKFTVSKT